MLTVDRLLNLLLHFLELLTFLPSDAEPSYIGDDHQFVAEVSERRPVAKTETKPEKREDDFFDLINQLDKYSEIKEAQEKRDRPEGT